MKSINTFIVVFVLLVLSSNAEPDAVPETEVVAVEVKQIVIGPIFSRKNNFDPATMSVARIKDAKLIKEILESVEKHELEEVDHYLMLPHLQVAFLDADGNIIAGYALDRTAGRTSNGAKAVLRPAKVNGDGKNRKLELDEISRGYPCKPLDDFRFLDQEWPEPQKR